MIPLLHQLITDTPPSHVITDYHIAQSLHPTHIRLPSDIIADALDPNLSHHLPPSRFTKDASLSRVITEQRIAQSLHRRHITQCHPPRCFRPKPPNHLSLH